MGCCAPNTLGSGPAADACKRVNYTLGMLLGVDDFVQESTYHGARRLELARELLGYGTVHGLQVIVEPDGTRGPRLRVMPGMAWLPSGTPVCVDTPQCANLNDWLAAHAVEVGHALPGGPPARLSLYVVLLHAQCLTDNVPIPGEPCRSEDELMQPSRVTDSFRLELRLAPPPQREEDAIRDFVQWLVRLPMSPTSPALTEAEFVEELRRAAREWLAPTSPPDSPSDFMLGSAPGGASEALFTAALRLWTTELRPLWMARATCGCHAPPIPPRDDALLLVELQVNLVAGAGATFRVTDVEPAVACDESRRPVLLSLRMVQELITRHPSPDPGDTVTPETAFGLAPSSGTSLDYSRADHTHGSPVLPDLGGDLSGPIEAAFVESLQGVPLSSGSPLVDGQVLTFVGGQWAPADPPPATVPPLAGDVTGALGANAIARLQGRAVNALNPAADQILRFVSNEWVPVDLPVPPAPILGGDVTGSAGTNVIDRLQGRRLDALNPAANQILRFVSGAWVAVDLPPAPAGQFVGRGMARPYEIVAAAEFRVRVAARAATVTVQPAGGGYGNLNSLGASLDAAQPRQVIVALQADVTRATTLPNYIVKLTAIWFDRTRFGFHPYLLDQVRPEGDRIQFRVLLLAEQQIMDGDFEFRFQVEVSRF